MSTGSKVYIETYGCSASFSDSEICAGQLSQAGYLIVDNPKDSDVNVIVTCTVKTATANRMFHRIKKLSENNSALVVAGCMPKTQAKEIKKLNPNASLMGPDSIDQITDIVNSTLNGTPLIQLGKSTKPKVLLPKIRILSEVFALIKKHNVSNLCGTTAVINMLINEEIKLNHTVELMTGAAPPPVSVLKKIQEQGFNITHTYGLTEVYGPAVVCEWQKEWANLKKDVISELKSRQGVKCPGLSDLQVVSKKTNKPVNKNGKELGEVYMRGNTVMMGYYKDKKATQDSFKEGWFHTGDIGVVFENDYIQLKDRLKDIIISGGENISTIEIENVLFQHPDILDAAVVGKNDKKWGEVPCAFITVKKNSSITEQEVIDFCRSNIAKFKIPKKIIFGDIKKTSTGKIKKFLLRKKANQE